MSTEVAKKAEQQILTAVEIHEVSVVREPGWEAIVYCPRTGEAG